MTGPLPPPGGNPSSGWTILAALDHQTGTDAAGRAVQGVQLQLRTGMGAVEYVFVPAGLWQSWRAAQAAIAAGTASASSSSAIAALHSWIDAAVKTSDAVQIISGTIGGQ